MKQLLPFYVLGLFLISCTKDQVEEEQIIDIEDSEIFSEIDVDLYDKVLAQLKSEGNWKPNSTKDPDIPNIEEGIEARLERFISQLPQQETGCEDFIKRVRIRSDWVRFLSHDPQPALLELVLLVAQIDERYPNCGIDLRRVVVRPAGDDHLRVRAVFRLDTWY